jgi:hypothetical protein
MIVSKWDTLIGMWSWRLMLLFMAGHVVTAQDGTLAKSLMVAKAFAGCYELRVPSDTPARELPTSFQLTMLRDGATREGPTFIAQNLGPKAQYSISSWKANSDDTISVSWSTGYVGYRLLLSGSRDELHGTARYWTDTGPGRGANRNPVTVRAQRVACKDPAK